MAYRILPRGTFWATSPYGPVDVVRPPATGVTVCGTLLTDDFRELSAAQVLAHGLPICGQCHVAQVRA